MHAFIRSSLFLASLVAIAAPTWAVDNVKNWKSDLEFFRAELPSRHTNLHFRLSARDFNRDVVALEADLPKITDDEAFLRLQKITVAIGDDHTTISPSRMAATAPRFPFEAGCFRDGIFIVAAPSDHPELLGARITAFGHTPIADVVRAIAPFVSTASASLIKHRLPWRLNEAPLLRVAGLTEPNGALKLSVVADGNALTIELTALSNAKGFLPTTKLTAATCSTFPQGNRLFYLEKFDEGKALYVQYNRCWGRELEETRGRGKAAAAKLPSLYGFFDEIRTALKSDSVEKLVFDLRWNGGGASDPGTEFIEEIARMRSINRRGRLFVLVGRQTFSSAILNACDFKENTEAVFVGEPTGGTQSHFGETQNFVLPWTGITVTYSTKFFRHGDGGALVPDIVAWQTFDQYRRGIDPAIEAVRTYGNTTAAQ
jgi:hypothetical protein